MRKLLTFSSFVIASMAVMAVFITATTFAQLVFAAVLYPVLVYFAFRAFPRKARSHPPEKPAAVETESNLQIPSQEDEPVEKVEIVKTENLGISDIDKRVFLKLIGAAGLSLFLFSIFNKKVESALFKSLPPSETTGQVSLGDIGGNKINPAQSQPMDGYRISEIDDNVITYYGFINKDKAWVVMRQDTDTGSFRYSKGDSNFPGNWAKREKLKYDYFSDIFSN